MGYFTRCNNKGKVSTLSPVSSQGEGPMCFGSRRLDRRSESDVSNRGRPESEPNSCDTWRDGSRRTGETTSPIKVSSTSLLLPTPQCVSRGYWCHGRVRGHGPKSTREVLLHDLLPSLPPWVSIIVIYWGGVEVHLSPDPIPSEGRESVTCPLRT